MIRAGGMGILGVLMMISFAMKMGHRCVFASRVVLVWIRLYASMKVLLRIMLFVIGMNHILIFASRVLVWIRLYVHMNLAKNIYRLSHVLNTSFQICMLQIS